MVPNQLLERLSHLDKWLESLAGWLQRAKNREDHCENQNWLITDMENMAKKLSEACTMWESRNDKLRKQLVSSSRRVLVMTERSRG